MDKKAIKIEIYGESHADCIGVKAEGLTSGFRVDMDELKAFLARRAPGSGEWTSARREADVPEFVSGLVDGVTDGAVLEAVIRNTDVRSKDYESIRTIPRPGHADYASWLKCGSIPAGGGRWSGRMTAPLCVVGGICKQMLAAEGIEIHAHIRSLLDIDDEPLVPGTEIGESFPTVSLRAAERMKQAIADAKAAGDSLGGAVGCLVTGVRAGVGDALFDGVEAELARMMFAIPAVKAIEFGETKDYGSENNDAFVVSDGNIKTATNNCGGVLGGVTTGMPIEFSVKIKPTPSIGIEQDSVDLSTMQPAKLKGNGRHDPCILPRAVPVVEAAAAIAIYNLINGE